MRFNPFAKPVEPSQQQMIQQQQNFDREMSAAYPQQDDTELIQMERQKERADLIKWQQDLSIDAKKFLYGLKRWKMVSGSIEENTDEWKQIPNMEPLANDKFIHDLINFAGPYFSKNLMMSNYSEDRILRLLQATAFDLRVHLMQNREEYEIKKTDMAYIVRLFKNFIDATPFRSLGQGERKYLGTVGKRVEIHSDSPEPKKKGIFNLGG